MRIPSITMLCEKAKRVNEFQGGSLLLLAHGRVGARAILFSFCISVPPLSEKSAGDFQPVGKRFRNFCVSRRAKQKNFRFLD